MSTTSTSQTATPPLATERRQSTERAGAIGALAAAATFIFGIALLVTTLSDYVEDDPSPADRVEFLLGHQGTLYVWYLVIFLVFGIAIIPLARALHGRLSDVSPLLADISAVFAYIWAGLMFATGMISNIGITAVADLYDTDPDGAEALSSSIDTVANGLGGGNELVGGLWILLVSIAAWRTRRLPTGLNIVGLASGAAGLVTLIPACPMWASSSGSARSSGLPGLVSPCSAPPTARALPIAPAPPTARRWPDDHR